MAALGESIEIKANDVRTESKYMTVHWGEPKGTEDEGKGRRGQKRVGVVA